MDRPSPALNNSRVVVLKHMFRLEDLEKDAALLLDLKEDVREECSLLGEVTNVTLYDVRLGCPVSLISRLIILDPFSFRRVQKEADGVMTVKFKDAVSAQAAIIVSMHLILQICIMLTPTQKMNGRFFDGQRVIAELYTGKQRFRRSGVGEDADGQTDAEEKARLDDFAQWLMDEGE